MGWLQALKPEVIAAYGGKCVCCSEAHLEFLSIDHVNGYKDGPRGGAALYSWLKQNDYPEGFRVLCMSCNMALGYLGYCGHSGLSQVRTRNGRTVVGNIAYNQALKLEVLTAYGGPVCFCCGENRLECLSIDHVNGLGARHRRENHKAKNLCIWLRQNNFPTGFRAACHNCNFSAGHHPSKLCVHERERATIVQETGT
jgi:hypothetical protein